MMEGMLGKIGKDGQLLYPTRADIGKEFIRIPSELAHLLQKKMPTNLESVLENIYTNSNNSKEYLTYRVIRRVALGLEKRQTPIWAEHRHRSTLV
jgi:hypothetical protein